MTQSSRLAAHRARASAETGSHELGPANPENRPDDVREDPDGNQKENEMTDTNAEAVAQARAEATAAANKRFSTVLASEHYVGREALAQNLLANDKLSAEEIISALGTAPKATAGTDAGDAGQRADEAARAEMRAAIEETGNSGIDAGGSGEQGKKVSTAALWDKAIKANNPHLKTA